MQGPAGECYNLRYSSACSQLDREKLPSVCDHGQLSEARWKLPCRSHSAGGAPGLPFGRAVLCDWRRQTPTHWRHWCSRRADTLPRAPAAASEALLELSQATTVLAGAAELPGKSRWRATRDPGTEAVTNNTHRVTLTSHYEQRQSVIPMASLQAEGCNSTGRLRL